MSQMTGEHESAAGAAPEPQEMAAAHGADARGVDREPEIQLPEITRWDVLCVGPLTLFNLWALFGRVISPGLLSQHFVLLEFLRGSIPAIITAGAHVKMGQTPLLLALVAPLIYLMFPDAFIYWAGRRYGQTALTYLSGNQPKWRRRIAFAERFFARWGALTIVFSYFLGPASPIFFLAAGEVGMSFALVMAADLIGTLIWVSLILGIGYAFPQNATAIADSITHYAWPLTALTFGLVFFSMWRGAGKMTPPTGAPKSSPPVE